MSAAGDGWMVEKNAQEAVKKIFIAADSFLVITPPFPVYILAEGDKGKARKSSNFNQIMDKGSEARG